MSTTKLLRRALSLIVGTTVLALLMASDCDIVLPPVVVVPDPVVPELVDVVLVNDSGEYVQPLLYADPRTLFDINDILFAENLIDIGEPLYPGEVVTVTLTCDDAGSLLADADTIELADGTLMDSVLIRQGEHFFCGEEVIMYYEPILVPAPVTVELVNTTSNFVDAFFWSDPGTLGVPELVAIPDNFIDVGEPLAPGEVVTLTLDCVDAGTFLIDGDLLLEPTGNPLPSENLLLLNEGLHFLCGDLVSFYYEVDGAGGFFISADVNDVNIAP